MKIKSAFCYKRRVLFSCFHKHSSTSKTLRPPRTEVFKTLNKNGRKMFTGEPFRVPSQLIEIAETTPTADGVRSTPGASGRKRKTLTRHVHPHLPRRRTFRFIATVTTARSSGVIITYASSIQNRFPKNIPPETDSNFKQFVFFLFSHYSPFRYAKKITFDNRRATTKPTKPRILSRQWR